MMAALCNRGYVHTFANHEMKSEKNKAFVQQDPLVRTLKWIYTDLDNDEGLTQIIVATAATLVYRFGLRTQNMAQDDADLLTSSRFQSRMYRVSTSR